MSIDEMIIERQVVTHYLASGTTMACPFLV